MVCAAAVEVQRIVQQEDLIANVRATGALLERTLRETFGDHPYIGNIRGRGLFWAVSLPLSCDAGNCCSHDWSVRLTA